MKKIFKRVFNRNDDKKLLLYGYKEHKESPSEELKITETPKPHMRWNPSRKEWVSYSAGRKNRTAFPPKEYCPLCPGANLNFPTEIPFNDFEVAIFPNRWSSFNTHDEKNNVELIKTLPSNGQCEVVVYSSRHSDTLAQMSLDKIELLVNAWIDRYKELLKRDDIKYVMPFENRGEECGVTLHHPHGQIYAFPFIPPVIKTEVVAFKEENFLLKILKNLEKKYYVFQDEFILAIVPPFARYAYEVWILPKRQVPGPWSFTFEEIRSFSKSIQKVVKGYDSFLSKKCPYIMGLHASPSLDDSTFHFHVEFYPPLRHKEKPKVLAGSESMAGVFIMDVLPEESAKILREYMK